MTDASWFDPEDPFTIGDASLIKSDLVPVGTYIGRISQVEPKRSSKKNTPFLNITCVIETAEQEDGKGYENSTVWYEMYVTPKTGTMVKKAVAAIEGTDPETMEGAIKLLEKQQAWPGRQVRFLIEHDDSGNETRAKVKKFLSMNGSAASAGGPSAPVSGGGFSI